MRYRLIKTGAIRFTLNRATIVCHWKSKPMSLSRGLAFNTSGRCSSGCSSSVWTGTGGRFGGHRNNVFMWSLCFFLKSCCLRLTLQQIRNALRPMLLDHETPSMLRMAKRSNGRILSCVHAPESCFAVQRPAPSNQSRFLVCGGTRAVGLRGATKHGGGLMVRGAVRVITGRRRAAAKLREALERGWVLEIGIVVEVIGKSAGLGTSQAAPTPSVAQVPLEEFLQLILVLLTLRLFCKTEAQIQPCADGQRATLFPNLTLTLQTFLFLQLTLCILLQKREGVVYLSVTLFFFFNGQYTCLIDSHFNWFLNLTWTAFWKRWQNELKTLQASSSLKVLSSSQKNSTRAWLDILMPSTSSSASFRRSSATYTQEQFTDLTKKNMFSAGHETSRVL